MHLKSAADLLEKRVKPGCIKDKLAVLHYTSLISFTQRMNINMQGPLFRYYLPLFNEI